MVCPFCGVENVWKACNKCNAAHCNSCGKNERGEKRAASNNCPYCDKDCTGSKIVQAPPAWGKGARR